MLAVSTSAQSFFWGHETHNKFATYDGHEYRIEYKVTGFGTVPLTNPPGETHFDAHITVYLNGRKVNERPILGIYTHGGCCDSPAEWVMQAKGLHPAKYAPEPIRWKDFSTGTIEFGASTTNVIIPNVVTNDILGRIEVALEKLLKALEEKE